MCPDASTYHWLWSETLNKLLSFERRVREGKDLEAAREFASYVLWSGIIKILQPHMEDWHVLHARVCRCWPELRGLAT